MTRIEPKKLYDLIIANQDKLDELDVKDNYPDSLIEQVVELKEDEIDDYMFNDSYVGGDEYNFLAYCICNYLEVDSGISIEDAYSCIKLLVESGIDKYEEHLKEYGSLQDYYDNYPNSPDNFTKKYGEEMYGKPLNDYKSKGIDPKEVVVDGDDSGDEFYNPIWFAADSTIFANACKCKELADKLESLSDKAEWLTDRIHLL